MHSFSFEMDNGSSSLTSILTHKWGSICPLYERYLMQILMRFQLARRSRQYPCIGRRTLCIIGFAATQTDWYPTVTAIAELSYTHAHCLCFQVQEVAVIPNMGNLMRYLSVLHRVKAKRSVEILALGGSITAGGYLNEFARTLESKEGYKVTIHNHGHGATEIQCMCTNCQAIPYHCDTHLTSKYCLCPTCAADSIFCVDIEKYSPDLVMIDFAVNDYGPPKLMDALLRKVRRVMARVALCAVVAA